MTARMYAMNSELTDAQKKYLAGLKGQAKVVAEELANNTEPRLAEDINKNTAPKLVTKQDELRVTLYYIIIFKGKGIVRAVEPSAKPVEVSAWDLAGV